jgi:anti-anti-sigma factor
MSDLKFEFVEHWLIVRFRTYSLSDLAQIDRIGRALAERIDALPLRPRVLLNFKRVEFVSSQVIGMLLDAKDRVAAKGGEIVLARLNPKIREALRITKLDQKFRIVDTSADVIPRPSRRRTSITTASGSSEVAWVD